MQLGGPHSCHLPLAWEVAGASQGATGGAVDKLAWRWRVGGDGKGRAMAPTIQAAGRVQ